ncbi:MAG: hypothetical protein OEW39_00060 [Deltaproteobacteria bacterium]|nr:hypothetical protein [Deltaproteobacteria bacterium]
MKRYLDWIDIEEEAREIFDVRTEKQDLKWAHWAWEALRREGLTAYENALELCRVKIRMMTLGVLYREFCLAAWDDYDKPDLSQWFEEVFLISKIKVGQLLGNDFQEVGESEPEEFALEFLIEKERQGVIQSLKKGWGDSSILFASLWLTNPDVEEYIYIEDENVNNKNIVAFQLCNGFNIPGLILAEIVNSNATPEKMSGFHWINEGAESMFGYEKDFD